MSDDIVRIPTIEFVRILENKVTKLRAENEKLKSGKEYWITKAYGNIFNTKEDAEYWIQDGRPEEAPLLHVREILNEDN